MTSGSPSAIGPYTITREIGRGGMGVVYLARDTRLDRDVAIKALPEELASDPARLERFEREAKTLAQLNHPNLAGIHGVEEQEGAKYLVLEYVEGETLADMLDRGPLPVDDAVELAVQIATGVEAAHEAGVIHRDLKPGNIIVTPDGQAKVLDFGLARVEETSSSSTGAMSESPTLTSPAIRHSPTMPGVILGTAAYMSPEQARGRRVDKRTDIWSFAVVLYETLTGGSPFAGETVSDSIGAVLHKDPDFAKLPAEAPENVLRVLRRCLARDRDERWRDMADVRVELLATDESKGPIAKGSGGGPGWIGSLAIGAAAVLVTAITAFIISPRPTEPALTALDLAPPGGVRFVYNAGPPAISPDGSRIVFVGEDEQGETALYLRALTDPEAEKLPGTEDAFGPFWSPDGLSIAFSAAGMLQRIDIRRGTPDPICAVGPENAGALLGEWTDDNRILFTSSEMRFCLAIVAASGGTPVQVTEVDEREGNFRHIAPTMLPDGEHFLYTSRGGVTNEIRLGSISDGEIRPLLQADSNPVFVEPDTLLYWRGGGLRSQKLDMRTFEPTGEPRLIAQGVRQEPADLFAMFDVSENGVLVYHPEASGDATERSELALLDRAGERLGRVGEPGNYYAPRFSRDGHFVAVDNSGAANNGDIWVYGVDSPVAVRLTSDLADESRPVWSPRDRSIAYFSIATGNRSIMVTDLASPGTGRVVTRENELGFEPCDWSADGKTLLAMTGRTRSQFNICMIDLETGDRIDLLTGPFSEFDPRFAPGDERFAFVSDETGQFEVYVAPVAEPGAKRRVSLGGGIGPWWRDDGQELFYRNLDGDVLSVAFPEGPAGSNRAPELLFPLRTRFVEWGLDYHVTGDGQRFIANLPLEEPAQRPMSVLLNWPLATER